jgi:hypothetical protein
MKKDTHTPPTSTGTTQTVYLNPGPSDRTRYPWEIEPQDTSGLSSNVPQDKPMNREERRKAKKYGKSE